MILNDLFKNIVLILKGLALKVIHNLKDFQLEIVQSWALEFKFTQFLNDYFSKF